MGLLTLLVHNEAMKVDPKEIYGWRVYMLACSACFGGMLFGMDSGIIVSRIRTACEGKILGIGC